MIGRSEKAGISLLEPTVSRRHASIQLDGDKVHLVDLSSKHGTYVNSRRVNTTDLRLGDIVVFGLSLVLRLEESSEPIPAADTLAAAMDTPTLIDPLDRLPVVAIDPKRRSTGLQPRAEMGTTPSISATALDPANICAALLPEAHLRLSELRLSLKRMVDDGIDEADPYPILASVESVLTTMSRMMQAVGDEEISATIVDLHALVRRVVERVSTPLAKRNIKVMADIDRSYRVRCDPSRLEGALALLLRCAGRASPPGNPVEIVATVEDDLLRLMVSHLGLEYPGDVLEHSRDRGTTDPLLRDIGEVQHLMSLIGGTVTVETRVGIGSTVRLLMPMAVSAL